MLHVTNRRGNSVVNSLKAADPQNILQNHKLHKFQNISSDVYDSC